MKLYGIANNTINLICAFITYRCQSGCMNNALSFLPVTSGVLLGSVLGPLLFLFFIYDLTVSWHPKHDVSDIFLYADNAKLFSAGSTDV